MRKVSWNTILRFFSLSLSSSFSPSSKGSSSIPYDFRRREFSLLHERYRAFDGNSRISLKYTTNFALAFVSILLVVERG